MGQVGDEVTGHDNSDIFFLSVFIIQFQTIRGATCLLSWFLFILFLSFLNYHIVFLYMFLRSGGSSLGRVSQQCGCVSRGKSWQHVIRL